MKLRIASESLKSRKQSVFLTLMSLLISVSVLLSVEHLRNQAKNSFNRTVSGVDLIVGAPSGQLNLLLYSVFRMGNPTNTIQYESYDKLQNHQQVDWAIPFSLGDSHRGFRVLGTSTDYFSLFKYGNRQSLEVPQGEAFTGLFEAVIGHDVANSLNYKVGDKIVIAHGIGAVSFTEHDHLPFTITGILAPTGTPVDKTVHISVESIEAIHWPIGKIKALLAQDLDTVSVNQALTPKTLSAVMLGLHSRIATFTLQRQINNDPSDRLMAIMPGVALTELWQMMANVENLLRVISILVLISSLFGLAVMLMATMRERQKEIAVLRVIGATPGAIFTLVVTEAMLITLVSIVASLGFVSLLFVIGKGWLAAHYGLFLEGNIFTTETLLVCASILSAGFLTALYPAVNAYQRALHSTLSSGGTS